MKVCILASQYFGWGKIGGFGSMSRRLAEGLVGCGVESHVIVPRRPGQKELEILAGVQVHSFPPFDVSRAIRLIRTVDCDIYHSQDPTFLSFLAQRVRACAVHVITCRDPRDTSDWITEFRDATIRRKLKIPLNWLLEASPPIKLAIRNADAVFVPAYFLIPKATRMYKPRAPIAFLPNIIDIPATVPEKPVRPTFIFVGRLDKRKRPELFLELARQRKDYSFIVIGRAESDTRDKALRERYSGFPNVRWLGYVDRFKQKVTFEDALSASWAIVNTASREGLPLSFLEAASFGCAVVSAVDPDGFASKFGAHAADGDFLRAIDGAAGDREAFLGRGRCAREYVGSLYEASAAVAKHMDVYERLKTQQ
jgi:glycosyltransferase involved in cell wall biosynthesis